MRKRLLVVGALAVVAGGVAWWRRYPRTGSAWVNRVVDPWLVRHGILAHSAGEIGLLEHVGRTTGIVRRSPVHPVATPDGFRIIVPLGLESHWARNALAAGGCRLQLGDVVHDLDRPVLITPDEVEGLSPLARRAMDWLGFRYLLLHSVTSARGTLEPGGATTDARPATEPAAA
jgi:hypothetical protein